MSLGHGGVASDVCGSDPTRTEPPKTTSKMSEVVVATSSKEGVVHVLDTNGSPVFTFKNCAADPRAMCLVGGDSAYAGAGFAKDYIAVAQSKKPLINLYSWTKSQVIMQFHVQEITTSVISDASGSFLFGGSKGGRIFCWQLSDGSLLRVWQAHFRGVTCMKMSPCSNLLVTCSEDGMAAAWSLADLVDGGGGVGPKRGPTAVDSWSSHMLAVKDMQVMGNLSTLRVATCSLDQTVALYDVHSKTECFRKALPRAIESLLVNEAESTLYCGADDGSIYVVDMSIAAAALSVAHMEINILGRDASAEGVGAADSSEVVPKLQGGHTACITSMAMCMDDTTLISSSEDGTIIYWDTITRQMIRKWSPPNSATACSLSNVLVCFRPEQLDIGVQRPTLQPFAHLKKYKDKEKESNNGAAPSIGLHYYGCWANPQTQGGNTAATYGIEDRDKVSAYMQI
jgi:pre-rRNA-processing protein IPI3